jgi:DNA-binding transcriptional LysR family regulator
MRYREIDLNLLLVFDALMRDASVSKAAKSLGRSQSSVSQALRKLREYFGDELFLTTRTGVAPTATALALADDVRQFVASSEAALAPRAKFDPTTNARNARISIGDTNLVSLAPRLISAFSNAAPNCRLQFLQLGEDEMRGALERGKIDLAIGGTRAPGGDVFQQKLFDSAFVIIAHRAHRLSGSIGAEDFRSAPQVAVTAPRAGPVDLGEDVLAALPRNVVAHVSNWLAVPHLIEAERDLIAVVPKPLMAAYLRFDLKVLEPGFRLPETSVLQFWHRRANGDPFNLWLRERVRELFARHGSDRDRTRLSAVA